MMDQISFEEFVKIEIRLGCIIRVEDFTRAVKPAYKIWADFGQFGILQTSAQVKFNYSIEDLLNKQVLGVLNLGEKNIAGFKSQFLLLGFPDSTGNIVLSTVDQNSIVANGTKIC